MPTSRAPTGRRATVNAKGAAQPAIAPIAHAETVHSAESGRTYRLERLVGKGGFGEVYRLGRVTSLAGKRVSFTGFLDRPRAEAKVAAPPAGATVQSRPGKKTDVLVRGRPNAQQIAGRDGGSKLLEIRRQAARGVAITIIDERQFWRLAAAGPRKRVQH